MKTYKKPEWPAGIPDESTMRAEFERQHAGRNLVRHWMRGTYSAPEIAALWNQHVRTAVFMASAMACGKAFDQVKDEAK